jgi:hypothetical protein
MTRVGSTIAENEMVPQWHCPVMRIWYSSLFCEKPNAQVNRQKCEAFLSALNRQLCLWLQGEKGQLAQFATFD